MEKRVSTQLLRLMETAPELWIRMSVPTSAPNHTNGAANSFNALPKRLNRHITKKADSVLPESAFAR